jgi:hypothetical protein
MGGNSVDVFSHRGHLVEGAAPQVILILVWLRAEVLVDLGVQPLLVVIVALMPRGGLRLVASLLGGGCMAFNHLLNAPLFLLLE